MSTIPSVAQLHRAIKIAEQIQSLESELAAILGNAGAPVTKSVAPTASAPAKRKYTKRAVVTEAAAADAVISGLLGKTKRKYTKKSAAPDAAKVKRTMSPEAREKIAAAQRKRWAKQLKKAKA